MSKIPNGPEGEPDAHPSALSRRKWLRATVLVGAGSISGHLVGCAHNANALAVAASRRAFPLVDDAAIDDLQERLARTRWPDEPQIESWSMGSNLLYMKSLCDYWRTSFDWRAQEARLNSFEQGSVSIDGCDVHFLHVKGKRKNPMPLLLLHGWPGSVYEFLRYIPLLEDDFTVIAPSLPGFGASYKPGQKRFSLQEAAEMLATLMTNLGYRQFGVQGGDLGSYIASYLGHAHPERILGIHLNMAAVIRDAPQGTTPSAEEAAYLARIKRFAANEAGYAEVQGTKPETLAFGLTDSPAGLAAWIVEKFHTWTDNTGAPESAVPRDEMLANISLYWFSGAIGSSFGYYYTGHDETWEIIPKDKTVDVPTGYIDFPREPLRAPREVVSRGYTNLRRWTVANKGGHFPAMECPDVLARDAREFFASLG